MILVIDVGTTSLRAAAVDPDGEVLTVEQVACAPTSPAPGLVEFDASELARQVIDAAEAVIARVGPVDAVGVATQRASAIVWDRSTGVPIGPAIGWQDLRTIGECLMAKAEHGLDIAPNQTATKIGWLIANSGGAADRDLCVGTVDSWLAWTLSGGTLHVTDHTNAAVTGLYDIPAAAWSTERCEAFGVDPAWLPRLVDSAGVIGPAQALTGAPVLAALVGDQQASLVGQGCVTTGMAKITFGTGGMLDVCLGTRPPRTGNRSHNGTFPIIAWSHQGEVHWGLEAIMLSAGTNIDWLRDDLGILATSAESHDIAAQCEHTDGVVYVPALLGLGTPHWDYGARGTLLGLTRGTGRPQVVRAVLEGVAHRGADMVEAAEADSGVSIPSLRVDGGMSQNPTFIQALADASGKPVEVSPVVEATMLGAAHLAGLATGVWDRLDHPGASRQALHRVEPAARLDRELWAKAIERSSRWIPELSALDF
jgi:glycerol kinase